jgi:MFS family permease
MIGATQMFGMAGGSAGQFLVGPMIAAGVAWSTFWLGMGAAGVVLAILLLLLVPARTGVVQQGNWLRESALALRTVFLNPQSWMCGIIAGLLFIPTTILDMVWGVRYLQEGHGMDYGTAVLRSALVPFGWIIGCPLLGAISDRIGRRKPVIIGGGLVLLGCLAWILYGPTDVLPPYVLALVTGVASGAAMVPYSVIKEANPANMGGTATGVQNFLNFTFSALLGPVFAGMLHEASGGTAPMQLEHYQVTFQPMLYGVAVAIILAFLLKETGPAVRRAAAQKATDK